MIDDLSNFENLEIPIYAVPIEAGKLKITDDGWTVDYLQNKGINLIQDYKFRSKAKKLLKPRNVHLDYDQLVVITEESKKVVACDKLQLAIFALCSKLTDDPIYKYFCRLTMKD